MANEQMIDFPKKYKYKIDDVDTALLLVFKRAKMLCREVHRFNETVKQARWLDKHRPEVKKLEMADGSILKGEEAEKAWIAFNTYDWETISGVVMAAEELEKELEESGYFYGE